MDSAKPAGAGVDFMAVAQQFVQFYYQTFDENRGQLQSLYRPQSMLTFEGSAILGAASIAEKLTQLPFNKVKHRVDMLDAQPVNEQGGIVVLVTGALLVDDEQRPMSFCQVFQLMREGESYFVHNDVFRLIYPA